MKLKKLILENKPEQFDTTKMRQHQCTTPSVQWSVCFPESNENVPSSSRASAYKRVRVGGWQSGLISCSCSHNEYVIATPCRVCVPSLAQAQLIRYSVPRIARTDTVLSLGGSCCWLPSRVLRLDWDFFLGIWIRRGWRRASLFIE